MTAWFAFDPSRCCKQRQALSDDTDSFIRMLKRSSPRIGGPRRSAREIVNRFRQRLISMGVGRIKLGRPVEGPMPMCWAAGFRGLVDEKTLLIGLKALDHHRERQIKRVERQLGKMELKASAGKKRIRDLRYYGRPLSYWAQFG